MSEASDLLPGWGLFSTVGLPATTSGTVDAPWAAAAIKMGNKSDGIFIYF
jgi:hypothetical protein